MCTACLFCQQQARAQRHSVTICTSFGRFFELSQMYAAANDTQKNDSSFSQNRPEPFCCGSGTLPRVRSSEEKDDSSERSRSAKSSHAEGTCRCAARHEREGEAAGGRQLQCASGGERRGSALLRLCGGQSLGDVVPVDDAPDVLDVLGASGTVDWARAIAAQASCDGRGRRRQRRSPTASQNQLVIMAAGCSRGGSGALRKSRQAPVSRCVLGYAYSHRSNTHAPS